MWCGFVGTEYTAVNMAPLPLFSWSLHASGGDTQQANKLEDSSGALKKKKERDKSFLGEQGPVVAFSLGIFAESEKEVRERPSLA